MHTCIVLYSQTCNNVIFEKQKIRTKLIPRSLKLLNEQLETFGYMKEIQKNLNPSLGNV